MGHKLAKATRPPPVPAGSEPPLPTPQFADFLASIATTSDVVELHRGLASIERATLERREQELLAYLTPTSDAKIRDCLSQCFSGFGYASSDDAEGALIVTEYITRLRGSPLWAIEKACQRYATGSVRPEELGARRIDFSARPSTAQMGILVSDLVQPVSVEARRIRKVLMASVRNRAQTAEDKAATLEKIKAWQAQKGIGTGTGVVDAARAERRAAVMSDLHEKHLARLRREYSELGLQPPEPLVAMATLVSMGWTVIQLPGGARALARPNGPPPLRRSMGG